MSGAKLLINGKAGSGKTSLLRDLEDTFVISRDGKAFPFAMPHMLVPQFTSMGTIIYGGTHQTDEGEEEVEGFFAKMEKYEEKFGDFPSTIAVDSVSKFMQDIIEDANLRFEGFDVHSHINREVAVFTKFVQEDLVANDVNVILINHVMDNDKKGLIPVGQGKFKDRGGFYSEVDHAILVDNMKVYHRGVKNQARTIINELPDMQYLENFIDPKKSRKLKDGETFYSLKEHMDLIIAMHPDNEEWSF